MVLSDIMCRLCWYAFNCRPSDDNAWLNAHYDPLASIYTFSSCISEFNLSHLTVKMADTFHLPKSP